MKEITISLNNNCETYSLPKPYRIINARHVPNGDFVFSRFDGYAHVYYGPKIFSNTHNDKVLTFVPAPGFSLSIFDINTNIERLYSLPQEFYDKNKISVIHLLDEATPVIAHNNTIYILKEQFKISDRLSNIYSKDYNYTLGIQNTLSPTLSANPNDLITTIDSSNNYLVSISKQGHITSWQKKDPEIINNQSPKTIHYKGKFFASGIYKKDNILCLGLNSGNICVIQLNNLTYKIIQILPTVPLTINWIQPFGNELLFAACDNYKKSVSPACCATKKPSCDDCIKDNENSIRNQNMIINGHELVSKEKELQELINMKNKKKCPHIKEQIDMLNLPDPCNHCTEELVYITISANNLKSKNNNFTKIIKLSQMKTNKKPKNKPIEAIYPLSDDRIIISIGRSAVLYNTREQTIKKIDPNKGALKVLTTTDHCFVVIDNFNDCYIDEMHKISWDVPFKRFIAKYTRLLAILISSGLLLSYNYVESYKNSILLTFLPSLMIISFSEYPLLTTVFSIVSTAYYINPKIFKL